MTIFEDDQNQALLVLDDGSVFKGKSFGVKGTTTGEICFNTSMTGYQEVFTDPSYFNQVLVSTNVHVGNYGIRNEEDESNAVQISGLVCKNITNNYSRKMADSTIQEYFEKNNLVCISDVDTRAIVRKIRSQGAMNCIISNEIQDVEKLKEMLSKVPNMEGLELSSKVTTKEPYTLGDESAPYRIAVLDFGTKRNILRCLVDRNCFLKVFPAKTKFEELNKWKPDAYFLSNGPGDPASMGYAIETAKKIIASNKPAFGICLGHQIIALAEGLETYKMHHGHRGANHPVFNFETGLSEITTQNHGFAVSDDTLTAKKDRIQITHKNLNDDTVEGIALINCPVFSVQYHPEASPGPHDSRYLFDKFIDHIAQFK